jgi:hypothetical protein
MLLVNGLGPREVPDSWVPSDPQGLNTSWRGAVDAFRVCALGCMAESVVWLFDRRTETRPAQTKSGRGLMPRPWVMGSLFLSSYLPLFALVGARSAGKSNVVAITCGALVLAGGVGTVLFLFSAKHKPRGRYQLLDVQKRDGDSNGRAHPKTMTCQLHSAQRCRLDRSQGSTRSHRPGAYSH